MDRTPHPDSEPLRRAIERCLVSTVSFHGTMCRAVGMRFANSRDLLTGVGAKIHGGRWNPPGAIHAVYGTLDPNAALAETLGTYGHYEIPFRSRLPLVLVAIDVRLHRMLDLTDGAVRRRLGVSRRRMTQAAWQTAMNARQEALTQAIGRLAFEAKIEALMVPSARFRNEKNLVIYPENLIRPSRMKIVNRSELS